MGVEYNVSVSALSLLPKDPEAEFEQGLALYSLVDPKSNMPLIGKDHLIDLATDLSDKPRAKQYLKELDEATDVEAMKKQMAEQFAEIVASGVTEGSPEEEQITDMIEQVPELLLTNEFKFLDPRVKYSILKYLVQSVPEQEQEPVQ